jgi:hypothetical protein
MLMKSACTLAVLLSILTTPTKSPGTGATPRPGSTAGSSALKRVDQAALKNMVDAAASMERGDGIEPSYSNRLLDAFIKLPPQTHLDAIDTRSLVVVSDPIAFKSGCDYVRQHVISCLRFTGAQFYGRLAKATFNLDERLPCFRNEAK